MWTIYEEKDGAEIIRIRSNGYTQWVERSADGITAFTTLHENHSLSQCIYKQYGMHIAGIAKKGDNK